ncbi:MAG: response regulator [Chloroflexi bacterium]|nr:response regulator [Chloroflexota bacterium]
MTFKLLIVDDHPETRSIIERVLTQQGYQVVTASNGVEALKLAEQEKPDLVTLDFMMPVMDGRETCQRLRQRPEMAKVPIMMFTAVDDPQQKTLRLRCRGRRLPEQTHRTGRIGRPGTNLAGNGLWPLTRNWPPGQNPTPYFARRPEPVGWVGGPGGQPSDRCCPRRARWRRGHHGGY